LRDWDYTNKRAVKNEEKDPFVVTTKIDLDDILFNQVGQKFREDRSDGGDYLISELDEATANAKERADNRRKSVLFKPRNATKEGAETRAFLGRVGMACLGGVFLIGPMLLMVLHKTLVTTLVTSSVCVFAFGIVMAGFIDDAFNVLSATAAYAAVLVVFVGTSSGG
jgi:uncharacterized membrane protein